MPVRKLFALIFSCVAAGIAMPLALKHLGVIGQTVVHAPLPVVAKVEAPAAVPDESKLAKREPGEDAPPPKKYPEIQQKPVDTSPEKPLFVRGVAWLGTKLRVVLSDGRTVTEHDGLIARADSAGVTLVDGTRIWNEALKPREVVTTHALPSGVRVDADRRGAPADDESAHVEPPTVVPAQETPKTVQFSKGGPIRPRSGQRPGNAKQSGPDGSVRK